MPNCFTLTAIGNREPSTLNDIDVELWDKFNGGEPKGNNQYLWGWYDNIGLQLALGWSWSKIIKSYKKGSDLHMLAEYLSENFTQNAWYEVK